MDFEGLNENQIEAVKHIDGPIMVIAGAGSGKTRVLAYRVAYLIEQGILPRNILAVTFTNKAAKEMQVRIASLTNDEKLDTWISTFHSLGARILRKNLSLFGYTNSFNIIDEDDAIKYVKDVLSELNLDIKQYPPKVIKGYISKKKNVDDFVLDEDSALFEKIFEHYNDLLKFNNVVDFDDLLVYTYRLFDEFPLILNEYRNRFQYVLVDEFQDTNDLQYKIVKQLTIERKNIFIVGDQDQSIYSFRGANVENIDLFLHDFPGTKQVVLAKNYRSTENILGVANSIICKNVRRIPKELATNKVGGALVRYKRMTSSYDEADFIVTEIQRLVKNGYRYQDIAIFYRANAMSRGFEEIFMKYNIPYQIWGGISFFARAEIKDLIAFFHLIVDYHNNWAFKRVINVPKRGIGTTSVKAVEDCAWEKKCSLIDAALSAQISASTLKKILEFKEMILLMQSEITEISLDKYVDYVIEKTGYREMLASLGDEGEDRLDNVREFKSIIANAEEFYEGNNIEKLNQLLDDLALLTNQDRDINQDSVKMMTFHQAKGLEFDVVFMVAMEAGIFPLNQSLFDGKELEEERRVCYVGVTRAREILYLTNVDIRRRYGNTEFMSPSMFLKEMDFKYIDNLTDGSLRNKEQIKPFTNPNQTNGIASFSVGDIIDHSAFGRGTVVSFDGKIIHVKFDNYGTKQLLSNHPSIRKLKQNSRYNVGMQLDHKEFGLGVIVRIDDQIADVAFSQEYGIRKIDLGNDSFSIKE